MKKETWKAVVGYEGLYEVSDLGRVRSLDRESIGKGGSIRNLKGKILNPGKSKAGRPGTILYKDGEKKFHSVYVLVALAFIGPRPKGYHVCHNNDDCTDNRLANIRYDTVSQNSLDMYRNGNKNGNGKLSIQEVVEIRNLYKTGNYKQKELPEKYNICHQTVSNIILKRLYSWLDDEGNIKE